MLGDFPRWWTEQLLACVPARWRAAGVGHDDSLIVTWQEDPAGAAIAIGRRRGGGKAETPEIKLAVADVADALDPALPARVARLRGKRPVALRLPTRLLLERDVSLPLAAARAPERVIGYEMDRLTPFSAADVLWCCADPRPDRARGLMNVRLSVISKASARPMLEALARLGLEPAWLEVPRGDRADCRIAVAPTDPSRQRRERTAVAVLAGLAVMLGVTAAAVPFLLQWREDTALDARIAVLRPKVAVVEALRQRMANEAATGDVVAGERAGIGEPLAALAALTNLLPDDTFLQEFSMAQRKLSLRGHSAAAARLLGVLADDPAIRNPAFAAPIMRIDNGQAEIFTIRADWIP
jgi:general secretion pathway protein L